MKKKFTPFAGLFLPASIFLLWLLLNSHPAVAQRTRRFSLIKPSQIAWVVDGKVISVDQTDDEVYEVNESLALMVKFDENSFSNIVKEKYAFEVLWFRLGSTRPYVFDSKTFQIKRGVENLILAPQKDTWHGMLIVKVIAYDDNDLPLLYDKKISFKIKIK